MSRRSSRTGEGKFLERVTSEFELAGTPRLQVRSAFRATRGSTGPKEDHGRRFPGHGESAARCLAEFSARVAAGTRRPEALTLASAISDLPILERGEGAFTLYRPRNRHSGPLSSTVLAALNHVARTTWTATLSSSDLRRARQRGMLSTSMEQSTECHMSNEPRTDRRSWARDGVPILDSFRDSFREVEGGSTVTDYHGAYV